MPATRKPFWTLSTVVLAIVVLSSLVGGGIGFLLLRVMLDLR